MPNIITKNGFKGINHIPNGWRITRLGFESKIIDPQPDHRAPEIDEYGYPYIGIRDIDVNGFVNLNSCRLVKLEAIEKQEKSFKIDKHDLIFCKVGTLGFSRFFKKPNKRYALSATLVIIKINKRNDPRFINYLLHSNYIKNTIDYESTGSTRKALGIQTIRDFKILVSSLSEQKLISKYLDKKTYQIDSLIKKIEKKIELLNEQKTALINEYVTKGLNSNVEMKNSGVEWIGEIPKHWEIKKGKYILKIHASSNPNDEVSDSDGIPLIKVDDLNTITDDYYLTKCNSYLSNSKDLPPLPMDILIFPKRGMTILTNKIAISKLKGFLDPNLMGISIFNGVHIKYIFHVIKNRGLGDICDQTTIPQINNKHIYPLEFPLPPFEEQSLIVDSIDKKTSSLDLIVNNENKRLDLLNEYRQSLISSIVTGKIRITEDMI